MRHFILLILMIAVSFSVNAQKFPPELLKKFNIIRQLTDEYFVFEKENRTGVVNKSGSPILPAIYNTIYYTLFNLFAVEKDITVGVVNAKNITVLPFEFTAIHILSPQRIHVQKNGLSFIVSSSNRFLADTTEEPVTIYQFDSKMMTSSSGPAPIEQMLAYTSILLRSDKDIFIIRGKDTVKTGYQEIAPLSSDGHFIKFKKDDRWGIIDYNGKELIRPAYEELKEDYHTGNIIATKDKKQSLLDNELKPLPAGPFEQIYAFNKKGIAILYDNGQYGLVNKSGEIILFPVKGNIHEYGEEGLFEIHYDSSGTIDLIDGNGKSILPLGTSVAAYSGNIILLRTPAKKMGAFHAAGYTLLQPVYDEVFFGNTDGEVNSLFMVRKGKKWGILDLEGKVVIPYLYDKISLFDKGYATAVLNGKAGVITDKNRIAVPFIYDETSYSYNDFDLLRVLLNKKYGFVDKKGAAIIPLVYEYADEDFEGELCRAKEDGKWGYLDKNGKKVIPFEYDEALLFYGEKTKVRKGNTWYEINKLGKILGETSSPH